MQKFTNKDHFSGGYMIIKYKKNNNWGPGKKKHLLGLYCTWI